jgi:hypothetical protein
VNARKWALVMGDSGMDWAVDAGTEVAVIFGYLKKLSNVRNSSLESQVRKYEAWV